MNTNKTTKTTTPKYYEARLWYEEKRRQEETRHAKRDHKHNPTTKW